MKRKAAEITAFMEFEVPVNDDPKIEEPPEKPHHPLKTHDGVIDLWQQRKYKTVIILPDGSEQEGRVVCKLYLDDGEAFFFDGLVSVEKFNVAQPLSNPENIYMPVKMSRGVEDIGFKSACVRDNGNLIEFAEYNSSATAMSYFGFYNFLFGTVVMTRN